MGARRFVVAAGDVEGLVADADVIVMERLPHAVLLEATADAATSLSARPGTRVSVFHNPEIAKTAFGVLDV